MSRSFQALVIAIIVHLLFIIGPTEIIKYFSSKGTGTKKKEHRIKVALQEPKVKTATKKQPKSDKKASPVKNKVKPTIPVPSMPKGKQLKKIQKPSKPSPKKVKEVQKKIEKLKKEIKEAKKQPKPKKTKPKKTPPKPVSEKKEAFKHTNRFAKTEDVNITKKPLKKKSGLYSMLSKKQKTKESKKVKKYSGTQIGQDFKEAYGEAFGQLSEGEKKYIIDNQEIMRRITQEQLNRLAPVNIPRNLRVNTSNVIEFYLHPNGDISGLKLITNSSTQILDDTSLQTIEYSYHRYPLPKQKTLVRYKVGYWLGGRRH